MTENTLNNNVLLTLPLTAHGNILTKQSNANGNGNDKWRICSSATLYHSLVARLARNADNVLDWSTEVYPALHPLLLSYLI